MDPGLSVPVPSPQLLHEALVERSPRQCSFRLTGLRKRGGDSSGLVNFPAPGAFGVPQGKLLEVKVGWAGDTAPSTRSLPWCVGGSPLTPRFPASPPCPQDHRGRIKRLLNLTDWVGIQLATSQLGDLDKLLALVSSR